MITASTYTLVVVPALIIALSVGAVLWSNASARRFDKNEPKRQQVSDFLSPETGEQPLAKFSGIVSTDEVLSKPLFSGGGITSFGASQTLRGAFKPDVSTFAQAPKRSTEGA